MPSSQRFERFDSSLEKKSALVGHAWFVADSLSLWGRLGGGTREQARVGRVLAWSVLWPAGHAMALAGRAPGV